MITITTSRAHQYLLTLSDYAVSGEVMKDRRGVPSGDNIFYYTLKRTVYIKHRHRIAEYNRLALSNNIKMTILSHSVNPTEGVILCF